MRPPSPALASGTRSLSGRCGRTHARRRRTARAPPWRRSAHPAACRSSGSRCSGARPTTAGSAVISPGIVGDARGHVDAPAGSASRPRLAHLVVQAGRRRRRPRDPVEHHVREQLVLGERPFDVAVAVAPGAELLDDPRRAARPASRRARSRGLRLRALDRRVPGAGLLERAPSRRRWPAPRRSSVVRTLTARAGHGRRS